MSGLGMDGATGQASARERELAALPLPELLRRLSDQTSLLLREEVALAKAELAEKGRRMGTGAGMLAAGAVFALLGAGALTATAIIALDLVMATWLAALIVTVVLFAIAGIAALAGQRQLRRATPPMPEQTVETVKEDVRWARIRVRAARQR